MLLSVGVEYLGHRLGRLCNSKQSQPSHVNGPQEMLCFCENTNGEVVPDSPFLKRSNIWRCLATAEHLEHYCKAACNTLSPGKPDTNSVHAAWWARQLADLPHPAQVPQAAAQRQGPGSGSGYSGAADGTWDAWTADSARWAELRGAAACALQQCFMGALQLPGVSGCGNPLPERVSPRTLHVLEVEK